MSSNPLPSPHLPLAHAFPPSLRARTHRQHLLSALNPWATLDLSQELGDGDEVGHTGCVNALCWSGDGETLISGSDDTRICFWSPSTTTAPTPTTPHPLTLNHSMLTGHRANIFSAKFLPHATTPTVVSCAGDGQVRVFDVERLGSTERGELDGRTGDG